MENSQIKDAKRLLESIGLIETTSASQRKNGTLEFTDPKEKPVKYTLHANGYYRKYIVSGYFSHTGATEGYQLNRVKRTPNKWGGYDSVRILIPGEYLTMAARIVPTVLKSRERAKRNKIHYKF